MDHWVKISETIFALVPLLVSPRFEALSCSFNETLS